MNTNKVSAVLTEQAITNIQTAVATIRQNLPFLVHLTPKERKELVRLPASRVGVLQQSLTFAAQQPQAMSVGFSAAEFAKDGALYGPYMGVFAQIAQLYEDCDDTAVALGADLASAMLDVYAIAKANNRDGRYSAFCDAFKAGYSRSPSKPANKPTNT